MALGGLCIETVPGPPDSDTPFVVIEDAAPDQRVAGGGGGTLAESMHEIREMHVARAAFVTALTERAGFGTQPLSTRQRQIERQIARIAAGAGPAEKG